MTGMIEWGQKSKPEKTLEFDWSGETEKNKSWQRNAKKFVQVAMVHVL